MKAAQVREYGDTNKIVVQEAGKPAVKDGQMLVKVMASGVNPFDITLLSGVLAEKIQLTLPYTIGGDFAGVLADGREVFGTANVAGGGSGGVAEYAAANVKNMADKPKSITWEQAASLPLSGSSALQAIEEHLDLQKDQKILIQGGAGGIGTLVIQLAKLRGAYVAATASATDREMLTKLGADLVIDYKAEDSTTKVREYDAVFDTVGGDVTNKSLLVIQRGGKLVTMIGEPDEKLAAERGVEVTRQNTRVTTARLSKLAEYVDAGKLKPVVDKTFTLDLAREAYSYFVNGHPKGKVVIEVTKR